MSLTSHWKRIPSAHGANYHPNATPPQETYNIIVLLYIYFYWTFFFNWRAKTTSYTNEMLCWCGVYGGVVGVDKWMVYSAVNALWSSSECQWTTEMKTNRRQTPQMDVERQKKPATFVRGHVICNNKVWRVFCRTSHAKTEKDDKDCVWSNTT